MSAHTVAIDDEHFVIAEAQARAMGKTPEQYLETLIEAASQSFDEILLPIRQGFDSMTDEEIDSLFDRGQKAARTHLK